MPASFLVVLGQETWPNCFPPPVVQVGARDDLLGRPSARKLLEVSCRREIYHQHIENPLHYSMRVGACIGEVVLSLNIVPQSGRFLVARRGSTVS